jgi:hypothetical protein
MFKMLKSLFRKNDSFDEAKKLELANAIAKVLEIQIRLASDLAGKKPTIDDRYGFPSRLAIGYVYEYIDASLRVRGQDMSDVTVGMPVAFHVFRKLSPNHASKCVQFLSKTIGKDPEVMAGVQSGGQDYLDFRNGKKIREGLPEF